ncbi:MAG: glutamate---cysteine ligase / carboxylate-amine ligase [Solirubrobacteraceae bacterium]|jgi:carboxylate-amine ligase|nr:glutamate---cysteine ligase / carboxylate-amine ligase [Solirubrobacteraceae bacterium]
MASSPLPTPTALRELFDATAPLTVGLEEEVMLLDPQTLDLLPRSLDVLARTGEDARFVAELPAAHLEIVTPPVAAVPDAVAALAEGRRDLACAADGIGRLAAAGVHPFAAPLGELNPGERYELTLGEYGAIARAQLVCALQVHVAVGGAQRTLAVYNALRAYLPELAALAASGPFLAGWDTGLASVRPKLSGLLPRQGVPPVMPSWDAYVEALRWGAAAGATPDPGRWWWELRPHPAHGTLEVRVPDAQARLADAGAVAAVVQALVARLAARHDAGDLPEPAATWRIEENRWAACRDGVEGTMADLATGRRMPTRERLHALLAEIAPEAERLGCAGELRAAGALADVNGAMRLRAAGDARAATAWLADAYLAVT